jgi:hypothetical protein
MAQLQDLRQISTSAIQSRLQGQASQAQDTQNRLQQLRLQAEPARLQRQEQTEDLTLKNLETERAAFSQGVIDQVMPGVIRQMKSVSDPAQQKAIYDKAQSAISQRQLALGFTPEEIKKNTLSFEQVGGVEGFEALHFDTLEKMQLERDKANKDTDPSKVKTFKFSLFPV